MTRVRTAFVLGAVLLVAGAAWGLVGLLTDDADPASKVSGFHRIAFAQGGGTVELGAGTWVGYYEAAAVGGSLRAVPDFRAVVRDPGGEQVNVDNYATSGAGGAPVSYSYRGSRGVAILRFDASRTGRYRIHLEIAGAAPPGADLALGRDLATAEPAPSRLPIVVGAAIALAGIALVGWGIREQSLRPHVVSGAS